MITLLSLSLVGCGGSDTANNTKDNKITETDHIELKGVYVDSSYVDKNSDSLRMVYVFYSAKATDKNVKYCSKLSKLTVNDTNTYESETMNGVIQPAKKYFENQYYSNYLKEVYVGESLDVLCTFKVPQGDLESGRDIVIKAYGVDDSELIKIKTDDIVYCDSIQDISKVADPASYDKAIYNDTLADEATTKSIRNMLNGYYFTFYVNSSSYKLEFYSPNKFDIKVGGLSNSGIYLVKNGYIGISYDNGETCAVDIPYEIENGDIVLYCVDAFGV